jgi:hypothetical protein
MKKKLPPTVLDVALEERRKEIQNTFLDDWTSDQFSIVEKAIARHFSNKVIKTLHGNHQPRRHSFNSIGEILGLAYTSSSNYAGYWVCNTDAYNDKYPGYNYIGFAMSKVENKCYAILWDKDENEIIINL